MLAGRWQENGESVVVSESGNLLDGQHRLMAIVASCKSFNFVVVTGIRQDAFSTIDIGAVRKAQDVLSIAKISNAVETAAALNAIKAFENGTQSDFHRAIHTHDVVECLNTYGEDAVREAMAITRGCRDLRSGKALLAGAAFWYSFADKEKSDEFFRALMSGAGMSIDDPVLHLRNRLLSGAKKHRERTAELLIRAIDYHNKGRKIMMLRNYENAEFPRLLKVLGIN